MIWWLFFDIPISILNDFDISCIVKNVANKNSKLLKDFKEKHPDCSQSVSRFSDRYNKLIIEVFGGLGNDIRDNENKIIKNISKVITIDK